MPNAAQLRVGRESISLRKPALQIKIGRNGAAVEELVLAVVDRALAERALRLDPHLVVIGADPALAFPAKLRVAAVPAAFELIEDCMRIDGLVHDRLHRAGFETKAGLDFRGRGLRRRSHSGKDERGSKPGDPKDAHTTRTSRNMPVSM